MSLKKSPYQKKVIFFLTFFFMILSAHPLAADAIPPQFTWKTPTPADGSYLNRDYAYLNVSVADSDNTSAFFDWNYSLIGYWSMDSYNSTNIFDNSTYLNNASYKGGLADTDITTGQFGSGLQFDGVGDYLSIPDRNDILDFGTENFTFEAWVKTTQDCSLGGSSNKVYVGRKGNAQVSIWLGCRNEVGNNYARFYVRDSDGVANPSGVSSTTIDDNSFHHLVGLKNGSNVSIWVDGFMENSATATFTGNFNGVDNASIGAYNNSFFASGIIDEVRIYNRALSAKEIKAAYNSSKYRLENNFTGLSTGLYNYTAYAMDSSGNLNISDMRNLSIVSLVDSRSNSTPDSGTWGKNLGETILIDGAGWTPGMTIDVNITDNVGGLKYNQPWDISASDFTTSSYTLQGGDSLGVWTIGVSLDAGTTWETYDTFTVVDTIPEFPSGATLAFLMISGTYVYFRRKKVYNQ